MKGEDVLCNLLLPKTKKVKSYQQRVTNRPSITNKKKKKKKRRAISHHPSGGIKGEL
jgi:hypothetical protein